MPNDESNSNDQMINCPNLFWTLRFRHWNLIRHLAFVIRHFPTSLPCAKLPDTMPFLLATLALYATMSLITLTAYAIDKRRAIRGQRRIKEKTLHLIELAGGWP